MKHDPIIDNIVPDKGPMAGGTNLTIQGDYFIQGARISIGNDLPCQMLKDQRKNIVVATPPSTVVNKSLPVVVRFPGYKSSETDFTFTYKDNPTIKAVYPLVSNIM